jgi:hypothetical protein
MIETSYLQAINTMLSCIGEAPVNTLDSGLPTDAVIAQNILDEVIRETQARGWWFNTLRGVTLQKQASGKVAVPANYSTIDHDELNIVKRGGYAYDLDNKTDIFTENIEDVEAVVLLDFPELPEPVRRYCIMRASRAFFERMVGEANRAAMLQAEESQAFLSLLQYDSEQSDLNIFNNDDINYMRRRF